MFHLSFVWFLQRLAEEHTAHSVKAFTNTYKDTGLLGVYAVCEPTKAQATLYAIMYELGRLTHKVSDEEVARAKQQLKTNYLAHVTGAANIADNIGKQVLSFGRRIPAAEVFARIDAVDASNVIAAAREYIDDKVHLSFRLNFVAQLLLIACCRLL